MSGPGMHDFARAWAQRTGWTDARDRPTTPGAQSILVLDAWRRAGSPRDMNGDVLGPGKAQREATP